MTMTDNDKIMSLEEILPFRMTKAAHRNAPDRGKAGPFAFHKVAVQLDTMTVQTLLKDHRKDVPALGMMLGAKGGKNVAKMAIDILRIWEPRRDLSLATVETLGKLKLAELKDLAKRAGVYAGVNKAQLARGLLQWRNNQRKEAADRLQDAKHFTSVTQELEAGRLVAADVIAAYPDQAVKYYPRASSEYKAGVDSLARETTARTAGLDALRVAEMMLQDSTSPLESAIKADVADAIKVAAGTSRLNELDGKAAAIAISMPADNDGLLAVAKGCIEPYHNAVLGRADFAALVIRERYDAAIWKLNGGTFFGLRAGVNFRH